MTAFPDWLHILAVASLTLGFACAIFIIIDEIRRPQSMFVMNLVWPLTALFGSIIWLGAYWRWGRPCNDDEVPFGVSVLKGASHCGAGCTLGDLIAEWLAFWAPAVAVAFGWKSLFADKIFAVWVLDFIFAFSLGILFQYFTIKPMRDISIGEGVVAALKADIASISAWQIGMYGMMALIQFVWFLPAYGEIAKVATPEFWFAMQIAMLAGFVTSYPVNWLLIRAGWKERM